MSQTAQKKTRGFRAASEPKIPTLICTGYVAAVTDGREAKSGLYNVATVEINGLGGSRSTKVYPCTRPEWFATDESGNPVFRPDTLNTVEGGDKILFAYRNNIAGVDSISTLRGLAGTEERFEVLQEALLSDPDASDETLSAEAVARILGDVLVAKNGQPEVEIGYKLRQQRKETGEQDEDGRKIYVYTKNYDLDGFWEVTEANKKKFRKAAEKSAQKARENGTPLTFKVAFDDGTPF